MDTLQFYPTPESLARKAWSLFENPHVSRVLEPSAGRGDLLAPILDSYHRPTKIDAIEINLEHHPVLREKGVQVVDVDFLQHRSAIGYSHIIMNPPFRQGVDHVLHAWDLLKDGELVAILNAETITNPCSPKRQQLLSLIESHGEVEFAEAAFEAPDTLRKTSVRVALVHLTKQSDIDLPPIFDDLIEDRGCHVDVRPLNELALPNSTIKNTVRMFNAAVEAMKAAVIAQARANYYARLIKVKAPDDSEAKAVVEDKSIRFSTVQDEINERYEKLKSRAWRQVLTATDFTSRFTNEVRRKIESELDTLVAMEFTEANVQALLSGLLANKTELDMQMLEEVFDLVTRYHSENRAYYRGWKSNDRHHLGYKIRATRFILPRMSDYFHTDVGYEALLQIADIDRAFAFLDGKMEPTCGMVQVIENNKRLLITAQRLQSDYFDIRFYKGAGTVHFFPRRKDLVDRLNRIVGRRRQWIPDHPSDEFQAQYEHAEKITKAMAKHLPERTWGGPMEEEQLTAHAKACADLGIALELDTPEDHPDIERTPGLEVA